LYPYYDSLISVQFGFYELWQRELMYYKSRVSPSSRNTSSFLSALYSSAVVFQVVRKGHNSCQNITCLQWT